jgi:hypothetical protein
MLIGFACVAIVLASLARPTEAAQLTARAAWYLTIFVAPLGVVYRSGAARAFWVGVAAFGWGQIVLDKATAETGLRAILNRPIQLLHQLFFGSQPVTYSPAGAYRPPVAPYAPAQYGNPATATTTPPAPIPTVALDPNGNPVFSVLGPGEFETRRWQFTEIGISVAMILIAMLGGLLAVYFYRTQQRSE